MAEEKKQKAWVKNLHPFTADKKKSPLFFLFVELGPHIYT